MRTSVFVGTSLDGFIARKNDAFDFLLGDGSGAPDEHGFEAFFATVDAVLMGRKTYDVVRALPKWLYGVTPVLVLSSWPLARAPAGAVVEPVSGAPPEVHARLVARGFRHVYVDGGQTIQSFIAAGLIDRIIISRVPVLIGDGIPLFGPVPRDVKLRHVSTKQFAGGLVQSEYEVLHG